MDPLPTIAIVGRPNVGKSTLFNRLIGKRHAVIAEEAGTTRDRISYKFNCNDYNTLLVDTGGLEHEDKENIEADIQSQAKVAINDADLILFVVDISNELTVDDFSAADILRKSEKPVLLVANKSDNPSMEANIYNFYELGFGEPVKISAIHKIGIEELTNKSSKILEGLGFNIKEEKIDESKINLGIIGKPNAGKSSLVNALTGSEKVIVSEIPGTTRDTTDTEITYNEDTFNLLDTAGLKRPGRTKRGIEKFSALRSLKAIERSDVVVLLIDGDQGVTSQDCHIAEFVLNEQKGLIIAVNKIDLFEKSEDEKTKILRRLQRKFVFVPWAPIIFISAKNKKNTYEILKLAKRINKERAKRIATAEFNSFMQKITQKHLPASTKIKKPKFMYASQVDINPPKFLMFFKNPANLHFSYPRYLENQIRKEYGFNGTAIDIKLQHKIVPKTKTKAV